MEGESHIKLGTNIQEELNQLTGRMPILLNALSDVIGSLVKNGWQRGKIDVDLVAEVEGTTMENSVAESSTLISENQSSTPVRISRRLLSEKEPSTLFSESESGASVRIPSTLLSESEPSMSVSSVPANAFHNLCAMMLDVPEVHKIVSSIL